MTVPGHDHPWNEHVRLGLLRKEWRQMPPWSSDDSVGAFVASGGEITECAAGAFPEVLASESVIVASDEWPLARKLSHSSDMFFLNITDWMGTPALDWTRPLDHWDREPARREPAAAVTTPWRTPTREHRHALVERGHATLNRHAVQVVGILPRVGDTLPPQYRFKGRLIHLKRCLQTREGHRGRAVTSLWSFDRMGFGSAIRWAWYEAGEYQPNTTTAFWGGKLRIAEEERQRQITHIILNGRSVPV